MKLSPFETGERVIIKPPKQANNKVILYQIFQTFILVKKNTKEKGVIAKKSINKVVLKLFKLLPNSTDSE